ATVSQPPVSTAVNDNELSSLYGKTSSGKVFVVPKTADMLTALFFTTRSRTLFTKFTLLLIGLETQSRKSYIVKALMRGGWLDEKYARGKWIRRELSVTMGPDYNFDAVPPEFNAWLLFRELVNLILANDFVCYIMFALSYFQARSDWAWWENLLRCVVAGLLIAFNVAVKLDAHRVVKDFAWYWGDFFFLVEQTLTFDGVFELAPHPMYSLGYAGYYGVALLTASSTVFYVSLMVHAAQFIFLVLVENPHIEKTYPSDAAPPALHPSEIHNTHHPRNLTLFERPDLHRAAGFFGVVVVGYGILLPLLCIYKRS
ncbi:phosphatidylethanolamine N-methyltransferase, partial [Massospora cicadina]